MIWSQIEVHFHSGDNPNQHIPENIATPPPLCFDSSPNLYQKTMNSHENFNESTLNFIYFQDIFRSSVENGNKVETPIGLIDKDNSLLSLSYNLSTILFLHSNIPDPLQHKLSIWALLRHLDTRRKGELAAISSQELGQYHICPLLLTKANHINSITPNRYTDSIV